MTLNAGVVSETKNGPRKSKDAVKVGMGLVGTMAALVLGLLVASAEGSYDSQSAELNQLSANIILLDRVLAHYGPETKEARDLLHCAVVRVIDQIWSKDPPQNQLNPKSANAEPLYDKIQQLSPKNDTQRSLQGQALSIASGVAQTRWLMYEQAVGAVSLPLLVVLVSGSRFFSSASVFSPLPIRPLWPASLPPLWQSRERSS
jgi:hypothetical protein